jgi:hypothetical protein
MPKYGIFPASIHISQLSVLSQLNRLYTYHLQPEGVNSVFLRNAGTHLPDYGVSSLLKW